MIKDEAFLDLEASFRAEILPRWVVIQNRINSQLTTAIEQHDLSKVELILESIDSKLLYKGKIRQITRLLRTGMLFGATRITKTTEGLLIPNNKTAMGLVDIAAKQFTIQMDSIVVTISKQYRELARVLDKQLTIEEQDSKVFSTKTDVGVKKANPINIGAVLTKKGANIGGSLVEVATSLQMSRVAAYGFAAEASARGITTYKINEQLDSRTCPVCREMDGKTFKVKDAFRKLDALIRVVEPTDLKLLSPFPKQDKASIEQLKKLSTEELREKGFDTPPFHPRCRGLLAISKSKESLGTARTLSLGGVPSVQVNSRIAEYLETAVGQALSQTDRQYLISVSAGVVDYLSLPQKAKDFVEFD